MDAVSHGDSDVRGARRTPPPSPPESGAGVVIAGADNLHGAPPLGEGGEGNQRGQDILCDAPERYASSD